MNAELEIKSSYPILAITKYLMDAGNVFYSKKTLEQKVRTYSEWSLSSSI